jgi:hypothetical protein
MNKQKLIRYAALGGLVLAVLAVAGYAFRDTGGSSNESSALGVAPLGVPPVGDAAVAPDDVVGRALSQVAGNDFSATTTDSGSVTGIKPNAANGGKVAVASAEPAVSSGGTSAPYAPEQAAASTDDRKIVQTASLRLQVNDVGESFDAVGRVASSAGGFVASSNLAFQGDDQVASVTIRVPAARYQDVLSQLRGLGVKVVSETSSAGDVTDQYTDLASRLRNLQATETQLLTLLGRANDISDILQVQDRLNDVRGQIEQIQGRMNLLDNLTDQATISVSLAPVVAGKVSDTGGTNLGDDASRAWDDSIAFLGDIAGGVIRVVVFAWWVPIFALPLIFVGLRLRNRPHPIEAMD